MSSTNKEGSNISEAEAALYDRQIRLWGLDAQRRLHTSRILLVGLGGLGAEVAKNIILSGIKSLTLLDNSNVTEADFCSQFLVDRADIGKNRAESSLKRTQDLNPMVEVKAECCEVKDKADEFFDGFDVVCATCCNRDTLERLNDVCHKKNILFYAGDVVGYYGYMFADLNEHEYAEDVPQKKVTKDMTTNGVSNGEPPAKKAKADVPETKTVKKKCAFTRLKQAYSVDWSDEVYQKKLKKTPTTFFILCILQEFHKQHGRYPCCSQRSEDEVLLSQLRTDVLTGMGVNADIVPADFIGFSFAELGPVCAVVGGILGQEIIKAVSQKDAPHNNFFFYNGVDGSGMVDCIA